MCFSWLWCFLNCSPVESWKDATVTWIFVLVFLLAYPFVPIPDMLFSLFFLFLLFMAVTTFLLAKVHVSPQLCLLFFQHFPCVISIHSCLWHIVLCQQTRTYYRLLNIQNLNPRLLGILICAIPLFQVPQGWFMIIVGLCFLFTTQIRPFFIAAGNTYRLPTDLCHASLPSLIFFPYFIQEVRSAVSHWSYGSKSGQAYMALEIVTSMVLGNTIILKQAQRPEQCYCITSERQEISKMMEQDSHLMKWDFSLQNTNITINSAGRLLGRLPFQCTTAGDIFVFNYYFALTFVTLKNSNWSWLIPPGC